MCNEVLPSPVTFQNVFILVIQTFYNDGNTFFFSLKGFQNKSDSCHVYENNLFAEYVQLSASLNLFDHPFLHLPLIKYSYIPDCMLFKVECVTPKFHVLKSYMFKK